MDSAETRSARGCIFCGGKPLSKEHVIAQWIGGVLHSMEWSDHTPAPPEAEWGTRYRFGDGAATRERRHRAPGNRPTVEVNCVCIPCNTGWMSALEGQASPFLEPMIRGTHIRMDDAAQLLIATWAVKTVFVLEFMRRELIVATAHDRYVLMTEHRPPTTFRVRLAAVADPAVQPLRLQTYVATTHPPDGPSDILCSTVLIGHLAVQVWGGHGAGTVDLKASGTVIGDAVMIWPPVAIGAPWPPSRPITEEQMEEFMRQPIPRSVNEGLLDGW